jgi:hypothetical protein
LLWVVIGVTYGAAVGWLSNHLLFRRMEENRKKGLDLLRGVGGVFLLRYLLDAAALFLFAFIVRHTWAIVAATMSVTVAVKISLFVAYQRKGGRFE